MGINSDNIMAPNKIIIPMHRYKYPITDIISDISFLFCSNKGLYSKKPIAEPIPSSAKFRKPNKLERVPLRPIKSTPRQSKNIFLEKNDIIRMIK